MRSTESGLVGTEEEVKGWKKKRKIFERETTGEIETLETRIAQPQMSSFPERMYKHTAGVLGKSDCPMNGLFVCQPLK